ncbi:hypothetical protein [Leptolyngbya ohadii]|uniref:hypothetical protein n=1 Tax=Leptolyngbya ohadii TaxID=1962290 RepID=UPI000B59F2C6|nr:hypothetical protein [Leptolyngbya ohadii]
MKAYEFLALISADGKLQLPDAVLPASLSNQTARVIVLVNESTDSASARLTESTDSASWSALAATQFLQGYDEIDSIYDES